MRGHDLVCVETVGLERDEQKRVGIERDAECRHKPGRTIQLVDIVLLTEFEVGEHTGAFSAQIMNVCFRTLCMLLQISGIECVEGDQTVPWHVLGFVRVPFDPRLLFLHPAVDIRHRGILVDLSQDVIEVDLFLVVL
jgi:hypothetical protein